MNSQNRLISNHEHTCDTQPEPIQEILIMKHYWLIVLTILVVATIIPICSVSADSGTSAVLYQTNFATDPFWTTNNPSSDYWDPAQHMYHFRLEPSTGNYAYSPAINYETGSFTFQYDVIFYQMDAGSTFRMGFTGTDMDFNKGPNVLTTFTNNAKYGPIMILHVVSPSAVQNEVASYKDSYGGPTVNFQLNTTYLVEVDYNNVTNVVTETVTNKDTGQQLWSYFINSQVPLKEMNRIYVGNVGDYGTMGLYAGGWIDDVRLTTVGSVISATPTPVVVQSQPTYVINQTITVKTTPMYTPIPTATKKPTPLPVVIPLAAIAIIGTITVLKRFTRKP